MFVQYFWVVNAIISVLVKDSGSDTHMCSVGVPQIGRVKSQCSQQLHLELFWISTLLLQWLLQISLCLWTPQHHCPKHLFLGIIPQHQQCLLTIHPRFSVPTTMSSMPGAYFLPNTVIHSLFYHLSMLLRLEVGSSGLFQH